MATSISPQVLQMVLQMQGRVNPSVNSSLAGVQRGLRGIQTQAARTNFALRSVGRGILGAFGFLGGIAGIQSVTSFMTQGLKLAKEQMEVNTDLYILLQNNLKLRHQDAGLAKDQLSTLQKQAYALQEQTGINQNIFMKGAAQLATAKRTAEQIQQLQPFMANILVHQRLIGMGAEKMQEAYEAIAKAITTGMARGLNQIGIQLSPMQRQLLTVLAKMDNSVKSIDMLKSALRLFAGEAKGYQKTLLGQIDLATVHIANWQSAMMKAFIPFQQQMILFFGRIVPMIGPYVIQFFQALTQAMWTLNQALLDHTVQIQKAIQQGWLKLLQAIDWFKRNQHWLIPLFKVLVVTFLAWKTIMLPINVLMGSMIFLFSNWLPLLASAGALAAILAAAGTMIVLNWKQVRETLKNIIGPNAFNDLGDFLFGTKAWNLGGNNDKAPRALPALKYKKGLKGYAPAVRRAEPLSPGFIPTVGGKILAYLIVNVPKWIQVIMDGWGRMEKRFEKWQDLWFSGQRMMWIGLWDDVTKWFGQHWDIAWKNFQENWKTVTNAIKDVWKSICIEMGGLLTDWIINPLEGLPDWLWQLINNKGAGHAPSRPETRDRTPGFMQTPWAGLPGGSYTGPIRAETYGPHSQGATSADRTQMRGAYDNLLNEWSAAISPNLLAQYPLRSWIDELDEETGRVVRHKQVADRSMFSPGHPTHNWVENWNDKSLGHVRLQRSPIQGPATLEEVRKAGAGAAITIHNNVVYHIHGGDQVHQIAELHRKHVEQLRKDIAEAHWRNNRQAFA